MSRLVMKFGGTSVADMDRIRRVGRLVAAEVAVHGGHRPQRLALDPPEGGAPHLLGELVDGQHGHLALEVGQALDVGVERGHVAVDLLGHARQRDRRPALAVGEVGGRAHDRVAVEAGGGGRQRFQTRAAFP